MKKFTLSVPAPCHERWEQMSPAEQGRFCASCQKTVLDFSAMSDRELAQFFQKPTTGVCGRFQPDQLNRMIQKPQTPLPFVRTFFQVTLPAFLLSAKATAQEKTVGKPVVYQTTAAPDSFAVTGDITIMPPTLVADTALIDSVATEVEECQEMLGEVVVAGAVVVAFDDREPVPLLPIAEKIKTAFTLSPNPATAGRTIYINWKEAKQGDYVLQFKTAAGQTVWTQAYTIAFKSSTFSFAAPNVAAGVYIVTIIHKKNGQSHSEKISIE